MDVQKAVSTPGSRDDAGRAGHPNVVDQEPLPRAGPLQSVGEDLHQVRVDAVQASAPLQLRFEDDEDESPLLDKENASTAGPP